MRRNVSYFNRPQEFLQSGESLDDLNQVGSGFHALVARRISDRWLFNVQFAEGANISDELLGSQQAGDIGLNWSNLADSEGSIQDGYDWVDNGDGTRTITSFGTEFDLASLTASRSRGFFSGSGSPIFAATVISFESLENSFDRAAS